MLTQLLIFAVSAQLTAIEGYVRDARTHDPIPLTRVELLRGQTPIEQKTTDSQGYFGFSYGAGGDTLSVNASGYEHSSVEIDSPQTHFRLDIELVRKPASPIASRAVVSVREFMIPDKARKEFDRGRVEVRRQDCAKAVGHFEKALQVYDRDASTYNELGNCYRKLGELDRAEAAFKRAQALSDSVYVLLNLAELYTAQKRFNDAERVLLDAIARHPNDGDAYYGLALVYIAQSLLDRAETAAIAAADRPHQIADLHLVLADLYRRRLNEPAATRQLDLYRKEASKHRQ
jgi:tetratricopeptide (TPR) repeat protein